MANKFIKGQEISIVGCPFSGGQVSLSFLPPLSLLCSSPSLTCKFFPTPSLSLFQGRRGVDTGPNSLVQAGLVSQLTELGWNVHFQDHEKFDYVNKMLEQDPDIGVMKNPRTVSKVTQQVAETVEREAKSGRLPLTLGGDHSLVS